MIQNNAKNTIDWNLFIVKSYKNNQNIIKADIIYNPTEIFILIRFITIIQR